MIDLDFLNELRGVAPDLISSLQEQLDEQNRPWFVVEFLASPSLFFF